MRSEGRRNVLGILALGLTIAAVVLAVLLLNAPIVSDIYYCHGEPLAREDGTVPTPDPRCI